MFLWGCYLWEISDRYGNEGYRVLKMFEGLVVGALLKNHPDPVTNNNSFIDSCKTEIIEMISEGKFDDKMMDPVENFINELLLIDPDMLSNIFCLYRIWGHPRVNIQAGMEKVMKKGTKVKRSRGKWERLSCFNSVTIYDMKKGTNVKSPPIHYYQ